MAGRAARLSAGLLLHCPGPGGTGDPEVLLGHMGGPYWARKDDGAWSIPKGEHDADEDPRLAAAREFTEELGSPPPPGPLHELGTVRQRGGKLITVFALGLGPGADFDADHITPGTFELEWPPRSGRMQAFPEIDRAAWFDVGTARRKLVRGQVEFLDRLLVSLDRAGSP
ncbi:NUDIX domain-containing protein [Pseudonocardia nigra]|uniref:NUDIX domain-containing protein n=1 Tax=Pseudonocardia nigra TaxID=1921578 RepID=UPI0027E323CE|nr:NUDIX domain-containing protein [Pseudonocardia nigra]